MSQVSKDICNVLSSGSKGNCEIYHKMIACDMGIPYSMIKPYVNDLKLVLVSHKHGDHINIATIKKLAFEKPLLRFGIGEWMLPHFEGIKNVDVYEFGKWYDYGLFKICIGQLWHDVPNCFYRIEKDGHKTFRATDTSHLFGIEAKGYHLFSVEHNYSEHTIFENIKRKQDNGQFAYQTGAINSHLSEEQARDFIFKNRAEHSQVVRLHESGNS